MKVFRLKIKFAEKIIVAVVAMFVIFAVGFWLGNRQRGVVVEQPQTSALGLAPVTQTKDDIAAVNLNTATAEELATLPGIGEKLAELIVAFREECGPFRSVWALTAIEGIGEGKLNAILPYLKIE